MPDVADARRAASELVLAETRRVMQESGHPEPQGLDDSTVLMGDAGVMDSLSVVTLLHDLMPLFEERFEIDVDYRDSEGVLLVEFPELTVGRIVDHVTAQLARPATGVS